MKTEAMAATQVQEEVGERKEDEDKTTTPKKEKKEEGDECPICLEEVSNDPAQFNRMACCGNKIHIHCDDDLSSTKMNAHCILCRAPTPTSHEDYVKQLHPWVKKKKAWALTMMGQKYERGEGVKQSYEMARILFEQAAQQGDVAAMYDLGIMYNNGKGVEQSYKKAVEYYEQAAHLGHAQAQYNLGVMYYNGQGVERDIAKTREWWTKAAAQGDKTAIKNLKLINNS
jgi:TPR repeat protein